MRSLLVVLILAVLGGCTSRAIVACLAPIQQAVNAWDVRARPAVNVARFAQTLAVGTPCPMNEASVRVDAKAEGVTLRVRNQIAQGYVLTKTNEEFLRLQEQAVAQVWCTHATLRKGLDAGAVVAIDYLDADGKAIGAISVNAQSCAALVASQPLAAAEGNSERFINRYTQE